jgi:hypothetical protein
LVEERTQIHYIMFLGRDHRLTAIITPSDKLSHTVTTVHAGFEPRRAGGERPRGMRPMSYHSATEALTYYKFKFVKIMTPGGRVGPQ